MEEDKNKKNYFQALTLRKIITLFLYFSLLSCKFVYSKNSSGMRKF